MKRPVLTYRPLEGGGGVWHFEVDLHRQVAETCQAHRAGFTRQTEYSAYARHPWEVGSGMVSTSTAQAAALREYAVGEPALAELERLDRLIAASSASGGAEDFDVPCPDGLTPYPFQRAGVAWICSRRSTLLADEMGLGKTPQSLCSVNALGLSRVLIVVPSSLRENWRREAERWLVGEHKIQVLGSGKDAVDQDATVVIASYSMIGYDPGDKSQGERADTLYARLYAAGPWQMLVCDEAHKIKNPDALRTAMLVGGQYTARRKGEDGKRKSVRIAFKGLAGICERKVFATGTPILNRVDEIWTLVHTLNPTAFPDKRDFLRRYTRGKRRTVWSRGRRRTIYEYDGIANADELQRKLRSTVMVRRLKKEVLKSLPPKQKTLLVIPHNPRLSGLAEQEARLHDDIEALRQRVRGLASQEGYEEEVAGLREQTQRMAFSELPKARGLLAEAKVPYAIKTVEDMLEGGVGKLVVFVHHKLTGDALVEHFGERCVLLRGDTPKAQRQGMVDRFQSDPGLPLFIGSIQACGVGLTLTSASHVLFVELDWTPALNTQAEDRCHRIGQRDSVNVYYLVADQSIDARIAKRLLLKQEIADAALDAAHT